MNKKTFLIFFSSFLFLIGCAPKESSISGDVFLTMANGSVKPIAGAEVYLFPLEADFDSSFVEPLKFYINEAKFNISRELIFEECSIQKDSLENISKDSVEEGNPFFIENTVSKDLICDSYDSLVLKSSENLENENKLVENQTSVLRDEISVLEESYKVKLDKLEDELEKLKKDLYLIALNEGNTLKNIQMAKIKYDGFYSKRDSFDPNECMYSFYRIAITTTVTNFSDYIVLGVTLGDVTYDGEPIPDELQNLWGPKEKFKFPIGSTLNEYSESIPGLAINESKTNDINGYFDSVKTYEQMPSNTWLDENIDNIKIEEKRDCSSYSNTTHKYINLGYPDIIDIDFGEPIQKTIDPDTKKVSYESKKIDWVALGKKTEKYIKSSLHDKITIAETNIEKFKRSHLDEVAQVQKSIDQIIDSSQQPLLEGELLSAKNKLASCIAAVDYRNVSMEVENCLANTDSSSSLTSMINESTSTFGKKLRGIFNSVEVSDLGYSNFEQLLNSYGKNRNAYKAVTGIQGNYEFLNVPNGSYVIFTYYEDRFNGVGYWLEEIDIQEDFKADLNNINFKKEGVYSYLRDKLEN